MAISDYKRLYEADDPVGSYSDHYLLADKSGNAAAVRVPVSDFVLAQDGNVSIEDGVRLQFENTDALVDTPWLFQTHSAGTSNHDTVLATFYNGYKNPGGSVTRIAEGEHVVRFGMESRWLAVGDPTELRGMFEWNLQIATNLTGAPVFDRAPFYLVYDFDLDRTGMNFGDPSTSAANVFTFENGNVTINGAGVDNYALRVRDLPAWFDAGVILNADAKVSFGAGQTWTGAAIKMLEIEADAYPSHLGSVYMLDIATDGTIGGGSDRVQDLNLVRLNGAALDKGTSDIIISATALQITIPTIGLYNTGLCIGSQNSVGDFAILSSSTLPSKLAGPLHLPAGTTAQAPLRIAGGVAPTSPENGDIWSDGTDVFVRLSGTTYTLSKT